MPSYYGARQLRLLDVLPWLMLATRPAGAINILESNSLSLCMKDSSIAASLFKVAYTANNNTVNFKVKGVSQVATNVILDAEVLGYGFSVAHPMIDPCKEKDLAGMCPMNAAPIEIESNFPVPGDAVKKIPSIIYSIPDLDLRARIWINATETKKPLACVEADLGNGKTVQQPAVAWALALIVILGFLSSAAISRLGYSNTAAHIASNTASLLAYYQAQALLGMTAVSTPPIVRAWTQNFQFSMGIIRVGFLQEFATWYLRATGGKPTQYLSSLATVSVHVQKRSNAATVVQSQGSPTVRGVERVGFLGKIESTNIFFTAYTFFVILLTATVLGIFLFKQGCELLIRMGKLRPSALLDFRKKWTLFLKGTMFRIILICFTPVFTLSVYELTRRDSPAEMVLAVATMLAFLCIIGKASYQVWVCAQRSMSVHGNPAYLLYSDARCLNQYGPLYIHFKANMYFMAYPMLVYALLKSLFVAAGQGLPVVQAVALLVLDLTMLIAMSVTRPYMNKKTNTFNISIAAVNFINTCFLLFFSEVLGVPALAIGIMGVIFFILNAIFGIIIVCMVLWISIVAIISKDPEARYQPMQDDRGSFVRSRQDLKTTELDALGATARGDGLNRPPIDGGDAPTAVYGMRHSGRPVQADSPTTYRGSDVTLLSAQYGNSPRMASPAPMDWRRGVGYGEGRLGT